MIYDSDLSPCKVFVSQLVRVTWDSVINNKSEMLQELYSRLSEEQKKGLIGKEKEFIEKMDKAWEPTKMECYDFFLQIDFAKSFIQLFISEWEETLADTNSFIQSMVLFREWKMKQHTDDLDETEGYIFDFVTTVVTSFSLLPFSSYSTIVNRLQLWIQGDKTYQIVFEPPIPVYSHSFSIYQHNEWIERVHSVLYSHYQTMDMIQLEHQLSTIQKPVHSVRAILAFLRNDLHEAYSFLLKYMSESTKEDCIYQPSISFLFPIIHYFISHNFSRQSEQLLNQLITMNRVVYDKQNERIIHFYHYLYYKDRESLETCLQNPSTPFYKTMLYSILVTGLTYPQGVYVDPQSSVLQQELKKYGFTSIQQSDPDIALSWLDQDEDCYLILQQLHQQCENTLPSLSSTNPRLNTILEYYLQENLPQLTVSLHQWKCFICQNHVDDSAFWVGECLRLELAGYKEKSIRLLTEKIDEAEQKKAFTWYSIYWLVFSYLCMENGYVFLHNHRIESSLKLFLQCKQRKLVLWNLALYGMVNNDVDLVSDLLLYTDEDQFIGCMIKFFLYQSKCIPFSECINECKNKQNLRIAKKAVQIEMQCNGGNLDFAQKWDSILKEEKPWLFFQKIV